MRKFTCHMIGDDYLIVECGNLIIQNGNVIKGVSSSNDKVIAWAKSNDIPILYSLQQLENTAKDDPGDYLFSISNHRILPQSLLKLPKKFAINYHNAPLPKYAGVYATTWAILNEETQHGITWHTMTDEIDKGNVLLEERVAIVKDDTMLSLNTKCHETALSSFETLLASLDKKKIKLVEQHGDSSYYSLKAKPKYDALIFWNDTAENIYKLYRALYSYPKINHIGLPTFFINNDVFIPREIRLTADVSCQKPGTIVTINDDSVVIATATKNLNIISVTDLHGSKYTPRDLIQQFGLNKGVVLPRPRLSFANKLESFSIENSINELYWVRQLENALPVKFPFIASESNKPQTNTISYTYDVDQKTKQQIQGNNSDSYFCNVFLAVLMMYVYRINNYEDFSVGFSHDNLKEKVAKLPQFYAPYVPMNISLDIANKGFDDVFTVITELVRETRKRRTHKHDVFLRYPSISSKNQILPLNLNISKTAKNISTPLNSLTISITGDGKLIFLANKLPITKYTFQKETARVFGHVSNLLSAIAQNDKQDFVKMPILSQAEVSAIEKTMSGSNVNINAADLVNNKFEMQTQVCPNNTALECTDYALTYEELNANVNQIAHLVIQCGAVKGSRVAVCLEETGSLVFCAIALMKIGVTYLPLDPNYPTNQLLYMLEDSKVDLLITVSKLASKFSDCKATIVKLDEKREEIAKQNSHNPVLIVDGHDIAYTIYTSGSTGKPKGVLVSHENIANSLKTRIRYYHKYTSADIEPNFLLLLSTSFDTAMAGILWPLLIGAKLTLLAPSDLKNIEKIIKIIAKQKITHIICVPALYEQILDCANKKQLSSLRLIILGGDYWDTKLAMKHKEIVPKAVLFNEYGVSEATIWSTSKQIYDPQNGKISEISVGLPMANTELYVFDKHMQLLPFGVCGELYLGGKSITQGYINQPELTASKFIYYMNDSKRLYKTGDICCFTRKAGLVFKGRADSQVKIRGVRIELPQIEHQLLQHDTVKQCVVIDKMINNDKHIVAYIVPSASKKTFNIKDIKVFLASNLPEYMMPGFFVILDAIPLTSNNKLERKLLPMPDMSEIGARPECIAPRNDIEKKLANMWTDLLNKKKIGVNDSFFELGGHSLLISKILLSVQKTFQKKIDMPSFLETPTIANLARIIQNKTNFKKGHTPQFLKDANISLKDVVNHDPKLKLAKTNAVLLTGATGFLGVFLLQDLFNYTKSDIYCLVRADDHKKAADKLRRCLIEHKIDERLLDGSRVKVLQGDLRLPLLGLTDKVFNKLTTVLSSIYHNGAKVHHLYDYSSLRAANVLSVIEIIKLASTKTSKKIHYVSTYSATTEFEKDKIIHEKFLQESVKGEAISGGYAQSKWVAERLLAQAKDLGVTVNIYRPTWILGHSKTGVSPTQQNHLLQVLKGCIQMQHAPDWDVELNVMPVDFVSEAIVKISLQDVEHSKIFNLQNKNVLTWGKLIAWIKELNGPLKVVSHKEWAGKHLVSIDQSNAIYPLLSYYFNKNAVLPSFKYKISDANVSQAITKLNIPLPECNRELFALYMQDFFEKGFINPLSNIKANNLLE